jgi:hypothetical protein
MDSLANQTPTQRKLKLRLSNFDEASIFCREQEEKDLTTLLTPLMGAENVKLLLAGKPLDVDVGPLKAKQVMRLMPRVISYVRGRR